MTRDDKEIVSALRAAVADKVGRQRFALWFGSLDSLRLEGDTLVVGARDQFSLERLRKLFSDDVRQVCDRVLDRPIEIQFRVDAEGGTSEPIDSDGGEVLAAARRSRSERGDSSTADCNALDSRESPQQHRPTRRRGSLETFVVGDENRVAFTAAEGAAIRPGAMTPLLLHGPTGCGKSHLLEGILTKSRRAGRAGRRVLLSAEQFTTYFLEGLRGGGLPSFRRRYRDLDLLLIDDIQFFAGKRATLIELQHTIDTLLRDGRQVVLSADRPPYELLELGQELVARFTGGLVCGIQSPGQSARAEIARQICAQRGYDYSTDVLELVASRSGADARQLSGALNRLHATSEALNASVSLNLAEAALADMVIPERAIVQISDVERAVCDLFGLQPRQLQSSTRSTSVSHPRMLAMWLARKYTRAAFSEIGHYFGRRSHSTVISAQKKVSSWVESGKRIRLPHASCNVQDAIRRVEDRLDSA